MNKKLLFPAIFTIMLSTACVSPIAWTPRSDLLGNPAPVSAAGRAIAIAPDTKYVNVTGGEIIKFIVGDNSFAWAFDGARDAFYLNQIAPPGVLDHKVIAYVAPNPLYAGGDGDRAGDGGGHK